MGELHFIFALVNAGTAVLALAVAAVAWRRRAAHGALPLAAGMVGVAIWSGAAAAMWYVPTSAGQIFWLKATFVGVSIVPIAMLILAFDIARMNRWRTAGWIAFWSIVASAILGIRLLNPGQQYDIAWVGRTMGPYTHYEPVVGPLYDAYNVFAFTLIGVALLIILRVFLRSSGHERTQAATLFVGGLIPFVASAATESRLVPLAGLDLAPLAFLGTGMLWLLALFGGMLLDVVPVARGALVDQMSDGVIVLDAQSLVVDANPAALLMLNTTPTEVLGKPVELLLGGVAGALALLGDSDARSAVLPVDYAGDSHHVEVTVTLLVTGRDRPARLVTLHDVTEEQRSKESLMLARTVFDTANEGIIVTRPDPEEQIVDVNEAFCRLTGLSREDSVGKSMASLQSGKHPPEFYAAIRQVLFSAGEWKGEVWQTRADGTPFSSWLSLSLARDDQDRVRHIVGVFTDITEISRDSDEKLRYNATHDALTGLPNRLLLDDRLGHALAQARREESGLAVLFVDLDKFKDINDSLGHAQGDALLVSVANRIVPVLRDSDTIARVSGDEFTIILADATDPAYVEVTARRVLDALARPFCLGEDEVHITASIGIALFPTDGTDAKSLSQHADLAMYGAKDLGRNNIRFYSSEFQEELCQRMAVAAELWGAIDEGRLFLLYQPQVDLSTGLITGVEALVRLHARDGTVMSPAEFIPVAEESELIFELGAWVLRGACADLAILHEVAPDLIMSVNYSARQFREIDVTLLEDTLRDFGLAARTLEVEITETALLVDPKDAAAKLEDLRSVAGLRLSLDDFGTGYSSFDYVRTLHADTVKIDRSFVELLPDDSDAQAIVCATITLAKGLHATVIAEGPETEGQVRFLMESGCNTAQGYYFSRPIPAEELAQLLRAGAYALPDPSVVAAGR